jgi:hypothetical protein
VNARSAECWLQEHDVFQSMDMEHAALDAQKQPIILNERPPPPYAVANHRCRFSGVAASLASRTGWMSSPLHHDAVEAALRFFGAP